MSPALATMHDGVCASGASGATGFARAVVRRFDRRTVAAGVVLLIGLVAVAGYVMIPNTGGAPMPALRARMFTTAFTTVLMIIAVIAADEAIDRGWPRWPVYAFAVVAAALLGSLIGYEVRELIGLQYGPGNKRPVVGINAAFDFVRRADMVLIAILVGGLATFVHARRRTSLLARHRQHEAERARTAAQRRTLELRLQALQARVEPTFLFGTLERIRALYRLDAVAGGAMLEDLIVYLRAALPHLRESTSTVAQETALTRAWLDIVARSLAELDVSFDVEPAAAEARLPALVLLPLVQQAIEDRSSSGPLRLHVAIGQAAGRLRIAVRVSAAAFAQGIAGHDVLGQIDERLHALFGNTARLDARPSAGGGSEASIELPIESALALAVAQGMS